MRGEGRESLILAAKARRPDIRFFLFFVPFFGMRLSEGAWVRFPGAVGKAATIREAGQPN